MLVASSETAQRGCRQDLIQLDYPSLEEGQGTRIDTAIPAFIKVSSLVDTRDPLETMMSK